MSLPFRSLRLTDNQGIHVCCPSGPVTVQPRPLVHSGRRGSYLSLADLVVTPETGAPEGVSLGDVSSVPINSVRENGRFDLSTCEGAAPPHG
jgi:hypothetical protein